MKQFRTIIGILLTMVLMSIICSCRSIQYVPVERIVYRDSVKASKDSVNIIDKVNTRDSIVRRDSLVFIYDDNGKLLRSEIWHWKEKYSDSNSLYKELKSKYDSLCTAKQDSLQVPYPVEKPLSKWQQLKMDIGGISMGGIIVSLFIIIWLIIKNRRK